VIGKDGAAGVKQLLPRVIGIGMALMWDQHHGEL
jgi:hypothetical protein